MPQEERGSFCETLEKLYQRSKAESKAEFVHVAELLAAKTAGHTSDSKESVKDKNDET